MSDIPAVCVLIPNDEKKTPGELDSFKTLTDARSAAMVAALFDEFGLEPDSVLVIQGRRDARLYSGHVLEKEMALDVLMRLRELLTFEDL